ncbi:MAG: threonine--tRNA ligase [Candidatus Moranbacteria bacterium]|nr:threonine--tRNA ligase [Candidatus Moranbacteria bacterium]
MKKQPKIETIRHSLAHVLAAAVFEMFPDAKFGMGPAIENGFYYDFDLPRTLIPEDLEILEGKIRNIIKANYKIEKAIIPADEAIKKFRKSNQPYKVELIKDLQKSTKDKKALYVSCYALHNFVDLCSGPHLKSTGEINPKALKLTKISGAYWKGDEKKKMLQRIYGVAFETESELKEYLRMMEDAEKRSHVKIGRELELFANFAEIGQGLPVWLPKGYRIRRVLEDYMIALERSYGYEHISTPHINRKELFETSGHWGFYNESMYPPLEVGQCLKDAQECKRPKVKETFVLKPMNCPAGIMVYNMKPRSYRELPMKIGELGTVYRYEKSGELHGLQRVRGFTQNDAHIYCREDQLEDQFLEVVEMLKKFFKDLGFTNYKFRLSLSDASKDKYVGSPKQWKKVEDILRKVLKKNKMDFFEAKGEAAFYGPKLDVQAVNVFGKEDSISTIQVDFNLPERFDLSYIDEKGKKKRPYLIHRALIGSFERFFAFLIEYYAGAFPLWLSPVQVEIIPVSEKFKKYGKEINSFLSSHNIRSSIRESSESLGKRIREAQKQKVNYMLVVGEKEMKAKTVAVRDRDKSDLGVMKTEKFLEKIEKEIAEKK